MLGRSCGRKERRILLNSKFYGMVKKMGVHIQREFSENNSALGCETPTDRLLYRVLSGDVVFSSGLYNAIDYPMPMTPFETEAFFDPSPLRPFELPLGIANNDFDFLFPGASKIGPQLDEDARLIDQTVMALGPDLSVSGAVGSGVMVGDDAILVGTDIRVTGSRAKSFVKSDRLDGAGHGIVASKPGAFVLEGGEVSVGKEDALEKEDG